MLFPISDDDRLLDGPAYATWFFLCVNIVVFLFWQLGDELFTYGYSVIPAEITSGEDLVGQTQIATDGDRAVTIPQAPGPTPIYLTLVTAMFMHGGFGHLFGNLLYLWIFGDNVEHRLGAVKFIGFYLIAGLAATAAQIALDPDSLIPNLGASGAISGVLGAYLVLFPRNRVYTLFFFTIIAVPAVVAIGIWIAFQFINGFGSIVATEQTGGVAYGAHIGGFVAGVAMALWVRATQPKTAPAPPERVYPYYHARQRDPKADRWW